MLSQSLKRAAVIAAAAALVPQAGNAQTPGQFLQGVLNGARLAPSGGSPSAAMNQGSQPMPPNREVFWTSKRDLLDAARAGNLIGLPRAEADDKDKVIASVERILVTEYQIPPLTQDCYNAGPFKRDVIGLLSDISEYDGNVVTDQPPTFLNTADQPALRARHVERQAQIRESTNRDLCDGESLGRVVRAPYKEALLSLTKEYSVATAEWIRAEAARRVDRYKGQLARQQQQESTDRAAADRAQATSRAAEQESINAENARIKAEQERRAAINKNRVGG